MADVQQTIIECDAKIIAHAKHEGAQYLMRLQADAIAKTAKAGQFVHLRVSPERPLRRPISIMRCDPQQGTIDLLYKVIGEGTQLLAQRKRHESLKILGPIGQAFDISDTQKRYLCIGGGVGVPPMIFAAESLNNKADLVLFAGSEAAFPFKLAPSQFLLPGIGGDVMMTIDSLEQRGIAARLASNAGFYGCFKGHIADLAARYIEALPDNERQRCVLLACGPHPMLHAVARLARRFGLAAQLSLEEYMACAVGGCAGCVVQTLEHGKTYYRRVCVDGPVFKADQLPEFFD